MTAIKCPKCGAEIKEKKTLPLEVHEYSSSIVSGRHVLFLVRFNRSITKDEKRMALAEARRWVRTTGN